MPAAEVERAVGTDRGRRVDRDAPGDFDADDPCGWRPARGVRGAPLGRPDPLPGAAAPARRRGAGLQVETVEVALAVTDLDRRRPVVVELHRGGLGDAARRIVEDDARAGVPCLGQGERGRCGGDRRSAKGGRRQGGAGENGPNEEPVGSSNWRVSVTWRASPFSARSLPDRSGPGRSSNAGPRPAIPDPEEPAPVAIVRRAGLADPQLRRRRGSPTPAERERAADALCAPRSPAWPPRGATPGTSWPRSRTWATATARTIPGASALSDALDADPRRFGGRGWAAWAGPGAGAAWARPPARREAARRPSSRRRWATWSRRSGSSRRGWPRSRSAWRTRTGPSRARPGSSRHASSARGSTPWRLTCSSASPGGPIVHADCGEGALLVAAGRGRAPWPTASSPGARWPCAPSSAAAR